MILLLAWLGCSSGDPVERARDYIERGRVRAAIEILEPVVREQHENYDAHFYYGVALTLSGEGGLAEWSLRRAMKDPARLNEAAMMIVTNELQANNPLEAIKILDELIEQDPENVALLLARAEAYARTRINIDELLADVERVREIEPDNLDSYRPEVLGYLLAVMEEEATETLDALGKRLAEEEERDEAIDSWYCTTMAIFAKESLDKELARERFDACVDEYPANIPAVLAAIDFLRAENEIDRAIEILERAMGLHQAAGEDGGLAPRLSELYYGAGRVEEAEALLIEAAKTDNLQSAVSYEFELAELYEAEGRLDEALARFEAAVAGLAELQAQPGPAKFGLADLAIRAGELDRALEVAEELDHPPFRSMIQARVAQERGDHERAIALYQETARLWPDNEYARYHAARSAEQLGNFDAAIELYRHATRISVETTNAMSHVARLLYAEGSPLEAYKLLTTQEQHAPLDEGGELLMVELMVFVGGLRPLPVYLNRLPATDPIGVAPRLERAFRALRLRGESTEAIEYAVRLNPRYFAEPAGARALVELALGAGSRPEDLDRLEAVRLAAAKLRPDSAALHAVRGVIAEERGEGDEVVASAYAAALELDPDEPIALLGRARGLVDVEPTESMALGARVLESGSLDTQQTTTLAVQLLVAGARTEALELLRLILEKKPHDGVAAEALARAALRSGDHSDRTLDWARRGARFSRSEASVTLLRDTYAARGDTKRADALSARLKERKRRAQTGAAAPPSPPDAG